MWVYIGAIIVVLPLESTATVTVSLLKLQHILKRLRDKTKIQIIGTEALYRPYGP
jgi:multisubunit Na+/H+ antiporter MnhG subunit